MKHLILIRHAKSSWDNGALADIERPLNKRGEMNAPFMGKILKEKYSITPDLVLSSPAVRAFRTAEIISPETGYNPDEIKVINKLYAASRSALMNVINSIDGNKRTVFLIGHNPDLTDLCNFLSGEYIDNIPTCGIVKLDTKSEWENIKQNSCNVDFFIYPKTFKSS